MFGLPVVMVITIKGVFSIPLFQETGRAPGINSSKSLKVIEIIPMESQPWNALAIPGSGMGHKCQVCDEVGLGDTGITLALDTGPNWYIGRAP